MKAEKRESWKAATTKHVRKLIDRSSIQDFVRLGLFLPTTYTLKELKIIHWEPFWAKPTPRQELLNWTSNALLAYLIIYEPQAIASAFNAIIKPSLGLLGAIM